MRDYGNKQRTIGFQRTEGLLQETRIELVKWVMTAIKSLPK
jgi:hypothetical protein